MILGGRNKQYPTRLTNAPAVFQTLVNDVLRDMIGQYVFVYLTDILVFSKDMNSHHKHVRSVLVRLLQNNLFKAEKCKFHQTLTSFLGFNISPDKVTMDTGKVSAVTEWPVPKDRRQLQRFLGFANFYRKFIKNYSSIAGPLHSLTSSKTKFVWNKDADLAFSKLKELFSSASILPTPTNFLLWRLMLLALGWELSSVIMVAKGGFTHVLSFPEASPF